VGVFPADTALLGKAIAVTPSIIDY
jgi:hypothetical protein